MASPETVVIVNKSFANSEIHRLLSQMFKIRESDNTITHSLIFPKQSKAFLVQPICELTPTWPPRGKFEIDPLMLERLENFQRIHRNSFVFLTSVTLTADEEVLAVENCIALIIADVLQIFCILHLGRDTI